MVVTYKNITFSDKEELIKNTLLVKKLPGIIMAE